MVLLLVVRVLVIRRRPYSVSPNIRRSFSLLSESVVGIVSENLQPRLREDLQLLTIRTFSP